MALNAASLTAEATRHAALNFAIADGKLAKGIVELAPGDYDNLLVIAGQLDMENGNHMLSMAVEALRGSADMLAKASAG